MKGAQLQNYYRMLGDAIEGISEYAIFLMDPQGKVLTWNEGARAIKGYEPFEIIGKSFEVFYTKEDLARQYPKYELEEAARLGKFEDEGWRLDKSGNRFWANVLISALRAPDGELLGYSKITRNLTEKRAAEEALKASEERFRLLINGVQDYAIYMLDLEGRITTWNEGAERLKGYTANEVIGKNFNLFSTEEARASGWGSMSLEKAKAQGRFEEEGWRVRKDGSRFWANVLITALKDDGGKVVGYAKVTRDLSERKEAEDELRALAASLEKRVEQRTEELSLANQKLAQALEGRDDFISLASHEMRSPLTALGLQVEFLEMKLKELALSNENKEDARVAFKNVHKQIEVLNEMIETLLNVSKIRFGKLEFTFESTSLSQLAQELAPEWNALIEERGGRLECRIQDGVVSVADRFRLRQVLANLLGNSVKYAPGSLVEFELFTQTDDSGNKQAVFVVKDFGKGIDKEAQERVFKRFERGDENSQAKGFGLGLYLSKNIVEEHGGKIHLESELDKYCQFTVTLPIRL